MNRYLLFGGLRYYPSGGFQDFVGSFDRQETAVAFATHEEKDYDWWHIVDLIDGTIVDSGESQTYSKN